MFLFTLHRSSNLSPLPTAHREDPNARYLFPDEITSDFIIFIHRTIHTHKQCFRQTLEPGRGYYKADGLRENCSTNRKAGKSLPQAKGIWEGAGASEGLREEGARRGEQGVRADHAGLHVRAGFCMFY